MLVKVFMFFFLLLSCYPPCFLFLPECILKAPKSQLLSVKLQAMASLWLESGFSMMMRTGLFNFLKLSQSANTQGCILLGIFVG